ncbi:FYVE, RhoGEF and PH domain-containing protein 6-like [Corythoichthys intestinalis]|uniref:FYVE, RhoGEF and PH domain-containing protein 6-like n=1 Tax=Corythoichthys intestinalis TaxID=161448 RepID=UPI0025A5B7A0|nr:FYVE, RhoGEF and PH domain-containing protein 6-like [Corythoichthys intestinalis]XP_057710558.1 FYVE, RhoGEF and PH domain-containing protein 6-like [Corythoichthys intestinalis]
MSTGVKKPPLAPKPKLAQASPPPVAPKPPTAAPDSARPSPATLKRTKPALAPKPRVPKAAGPSARAQLIASPGQDLEDNLSPLDSRNGTLSERESDDVVPACACGPRDGCRCRALENGAQQLKNGILEGAPNGTEEFSRVSEKLRDEPDGRRRSDRANEGDGTRVDASSPAAERHERPDCGDGSVPAPPSKPLPVPHPRKHGKPILARQDGVEGSAPESDDQKEENAVSRENDDDAPAPPPRQTSLSPRLQRTRPASPKPHKNISLGPLSRPHPAGEPEAEERAGNREEDGYGDFKRYPVTHSLPKQLKLGRPPPPPHPRRAFSAEDRPPPRKPQRHSLPAPPPPPLGPSRELPAPPREKASRRFARPGVTFFSRHMPTRSSVPPKSRAPALGGKQRAQSFSTADLATRLDPKQRGLSLRKLLELRVSVKMLPKMLAKGGHSPDRAERGRRPNSCVDVVGDDDDAGGAEYENVPLYEEIPEYMNLPFHNGDPRWSRDADDVYEAQDPYRRFGEDSERPRRDVHSEEEDEAARSWDEDEDDSSSSGKEHADEADKQEEDETKRKKVAHIAREIMSSEKVFVDVLKLLHIDFRDAVAKATRQNGKPAVDDRVLSQVLYYLPQLYQLNKDLLRELEERVAHWSEHQRLADIFVQKGPYLKMYSTYIRQFDNNVALLDEQCRKNPAFAAAVREFETSARCASLALKHYLLKPVQRIPQYQLLLTDYLKNLPRDSEDYKDTEAALGIVKEVAKHANDIMKQGDNFQKLMQIQYSLNGHHEIVQPGRVFLKEGTLMKLSRKVMQPRMFFLFNDALVYATPVQSAQYKLNCVLSLAGMKVSKPSQEAYQNELNIESVERSFILSASSATERDEWLEAIAEAIDDHAKKKISFISSRGQEEADGALDVGAPLGSKAPIWIPDLRATMCMICTCEFTLTWRRHHCRACGKVVCQACSNNKYYLEYLKNQPARVCDHCFAKLQENSDRRASSSISPIKSGAFSFTRKQKKIPAALKEVSANTENSSMSGYLNRSKDYKKPWKRLWFVIENKVLYTYAASEDVAALESQPLLGFFLREEKNGPARKLQFKLYHKNTLFYIFKADDIPTAQRWIEAFQEAMILEE